MECKKVLKSYLNKSTSSAKKKSASSSSEDLTAIFLSTSDYNRFGSLIADPRQDMLKGNSNYPRTVTSAYDMLMRFELESTRLHHTERMGDKGNRENSWGRGGRDHTFVQHTAPSGKVFIPGLNGRTSYHIKCFNFEKWVHYENQCPEPTREETPNNSGQNLAQIGRCFAQRSSCGVVSNNWILLESCSTIICTKNNSIVSNVTVIPSEEHLHIYSNGGHMDYIMRDTLDILHMGIYVNNNSMANILSIKEVANYFRMTIDTKEYHAMLAHYSKDEAYHFKKCGKGLYYPDVSNPEIIILIT